LPEQFPLNDKIPYPKGVANGRSSWVLETNRQLRRNRRAAMGLVAGLTLLFGMLGMLPWWGERMYSPDRLANHLNSNMPMGNAHLGAEYYNIASALVRGRGFSDPFVVESGPTAWMPPLLVWIQAFFIWCFSGDRFWVMTVIVGIKTMLLAICAATVVRQGRRAADAWWAFAVALAFLLTEFYSCFAFTHDSWLILTGVTGTVWGLVAMDRLTARKSLSHLTAAFWGVGGGIIALSSPVAGFTWAVGTTICLLKRSPTKLALAALVSMVIVTPWAVRNHHVLGKLIPIKSNVYFELDQSLAVDDDGLLDYQAMSKHPYHAGVEQDRYVALGEIAYVETKKNRFLQQRRDDPQEFLTRVKRRLVGVTLFPLGFSEYSFFSPMLPFMWLLYPLPCIAVFTLVARRVAGRPMSSIQFWSIVVYVAYLLPYIICSYYPRYGFPLLIIKMMLCFWLVSLIRKPIQKMRESLEY
jgi:hypothetical protein